jgi:hypothetical protein
MSGRKARPRRYSMQLAWPNYDSLSVVYPRGVWDDAQTSRACGCQLETLLIEWPRGEAAPAGGGGAGKVEIGALAVLRITGPHICGN